ncbi:MAG: two-component system, OmpR family, sensor histidine kinase SenX3 [Actinomycetota bacterium]|jgi:two-component system sensor histidine kinase SenX3|nr:two-component system, OmpR family, sensor histidine kinase SenX3 [Actinomycetota bacterium]
MPIADIIAIAFALGIVLAGAVVIRLQRRGLVRRLGALNARLGDEELRLEARGMDGALTQLETLVDEKVADTGDVAVDSTRLEIALGRVTQGVVIANEDGAVVFRNTRAIELFGIEPDEEIESIIGDLLLSATEGRVQERAIELPGPPVLQLDAVAYPLDDKWRTVGGVVVVDDRSERQRLEAVRRDFVTNISHELKTPVGALALLAETLSSEQDMVVVHRLARRVQAEASRVERVVDDLIDLSRIQSEEVPVRERVAVHLIVAQAAERVRVAAQDKEMTINFGEPPQRLWVLGDRRQLVSAVFSLLENAVKYSPVGSVVEVRGRVSREAGGSRVEISVRDQGIGIPERDHERIFERFYRVESARAVNVGGTGLGLSIVRHVVVNHGGEVLVESQEGGGSTFTLVLPSAIAPAAISPAAKSPTGKSPTAKSPTGSAPTAKSTGSAPAKAG